ncbi:Cupredoxin [Dichotomocladium elegans]|nr:Cupredoxin [Dichotomocladium elegans]
MRFFLSSLLLALFTNPLVQVTFAADRHYYIAAEEITWDYAPTNHDNLHDLPLEMSPARFYTDNNATRIGKVYRKAMFRQYRDPQFERMTSRDPFMGFIGPIIRAESNDRIYVTLYNKASRPYSLHPYVPDLVSQGPLHICEPGEMYTYVWDVPIVNDTRLWAYISRADPVRDVHAGLFGPLVIYPADTLQRESPGAPEKPYMVDQEVFTAMTITDENMSHYIQASAEEAGNVPVTRDGAFLESNRMYHINGYIFNNNPLLNLYWGQRVRWYVLSIGLGDDDPHTAHWHGATLLQHGHRLDVVDLLPVSFEWLDMMPDNEGQWLFHCHVAQHFDAGMTAFYQVEKLEYNGEEGWGKK